jgi:hypothetical protein
MFAGGNPNFNFSGPSPYQTSTPGGFSAASPPPASGAPAASYAPGGYGAGGAQGGWQGGMQGTGYYGNDPFGYTGGSFMTPYTQPMPALPNLNMNPGGGGGAFAPTMGAFNYRPMSRFEFDAPDAFGAYSGFQRFDNGPAFTYDPFRPRDPFTAPSYDEATNDPGYQFRLKQGQQMLENSAAAGGVLRTGGTAKGLIDYGQQAASQEYQNVYNRRASEYDRTYGNEAGAYGINRGNAAENFDRNLSNRFQTHQANQMNNLSAYQANQATAHNNARNQLDAANLGWQVHSGTWNANQQNALQGWNSQMQLYNAASMHNAGAGAAGAAAANAAAQQNYQNQMGQWTAGQGNFWGNQQNQFNMLSGIAGMGQGAAGTMGNWAGQFGGNMGNYAGAWGNNMMNAGTNMGNWAGGYAGNLGNLYTGGANAQAAGVMGGANAWGNAFNNIGNLAGGAGMYFGTQQPNGWSGFTGNPSFTGNPNMQYGGW